MVALGYGIGLPLMVFDANELIAHNFSGDYQMHGGLYYNFFGSLVVALGHVGHADADRAERSPVLAHRSGWRPSGEWHSPIT